MTTTMKLSPMSGALLVIGLVSLAACDNQPDQATTTTRLDSVELEPGTITDGLVVLDTRDGAALTPNVPGAVGDQAGNETETASANAGASDDLDSATDEPSESGDTPAPAETEDDEQ